MAAELLTAMCKTGGMPENFDDDGVTVAFNTHSGCVFLTNSECEVAMMNGDNLESWYSCPICGHEGFAEDMPHSENETECQAYLMGIGVIENPDEDD